MALLRSNLSRNGSGMFETWWVRVIGRPRGYGEMVEQVSQLMMPRWKQVRNQLIYGVFGVF
jgi:hypothetical protein